MFSLLSEESRAELEAFVMECVEQRLQSLSLGSPWLSVTEAAEYVRLSPSMMRRLIARGKIEAHGIGRRRLLHRDDLDRLVRGDGGGGNASRTPPRRRPVP